MRIRLKERPAHWLLCGLRSAGLAGLLLVGLPGCRNLPGGCTTCGPTVATSDTASPAGTAVASQENLPAAAASASVASKPPAEAEDDAPIVVRGQDGGMQLPPGFEPAADGGRHSRNPLPVSGQTDPRVAQGGRPSGTIPAPAPGNPPPGTGTLPAPATPPSYQQGGAMPRQQPLPQTYNPGSPPAPVGVLPPPSDVVDGNIFNDPALNGSPYAPTAPPLVPRENVADLYVDGWPGRTGRIMLGGAVNSDAGVTGQFTIDERNFDIRRWPRSFRELFSGNAFRGDGQTFRLEAMPGNLFQRYSVQFGEPNLFDTNVSMNVSGFLFDRRFQDWDENRIGGRIAFGYRVSPFLSLTTAFQGQSVEITNPRVSGVPEIDQVLGQSDLLTGQFRLQHDTRDTPFIPSQGHLLRWTYEQAFGDYNYPRSELEYRRFFLVRQRADGTGKHTLTVGSTFGVSGEETPVFENFFAGGFATLRGFDFRGASPIVGGAQVGGRFSWVNTIEYMAPLTADDAFRAVAFVDFGTVERDFHIKDDNFRVAPGFGFRVAVPAMGPAPLAFDFAFPVAMADNDDERVFSFYMSASR